MRKKVTETSSDYKIIVVDDDRGILDSLSVIIKRLGYGFTGFTNPVEAIERIREEDFDLLILDFLMEPIQGDEVVRRLREFNTDLYILLLTGYKDVAPPLDTIKALDIQGYCEKANNFDQLILLVESALKAVSQKKTIKKYKDGLKLLVDCMPKIYKLDSLENLINNILIEILNIVRGCNGFLLLEDFSLSPENLSIYRGIGQFDISLDKLKKTIDPEFAKSIERARGDMEIVRYGKGIIVPLKSEYTKSLGIMYIEIELFHEELEIIKIYALHASNSIYNTFLHSVVGMKSEELNNIYAELKNRYIDAIQVLRLAVDARDEYTRGHSDRVAFYSLKIGEMFGLSKEDLHKLRTGGVFHDIGKIGISDSILFKTSRLTEEEFEEIKSHPLKGAHILSPISMFKDIIPLVKYHHERIDGTGYPEGLKGDEIPFLARILCVADAYDAMTSDRKYRCKLSKKEVLEQLENGSGTQFDKNIVDKFLPFVKNLENDLKNNFEDNYKDIGEINSDSFTLMRK